MTVTSMAQSATPNTLVLLQKLLTQDQTSSIAGHDRTPQLRSKLSTAVTALTCTPALCTVSLEVVSSAVLSLNPLEVISTLDPSLSAALQDVWTLFDKLFSHNPKGWSIKLFKWCVSLLARVSTGNSSNLSLEDMLRKVLTNSLLSPLLELLGKCTKHLVWLGRGQECMEVLLSACSEHAPSLNWLMAHIVSLHPPELTSLLLDHTLSSRLGPAHESSFANLCKVLSHLAQSHRHAIRVCLVGHMTQLLAGEKAAGEGGGKTEKKGGGENSNGGVEDDGRLMKMFLLLKLLTSCRPLLDVVGEDILDQVTSKKMMAALVKGTMSSPLFNKKVEDASMSSAGDEDEGEILSDEDNMEGVATKADEEVKITVKEVVALLCELISQLPGKLACSAVGIAFDMYVESKGLHTAQEEGLEEGEIVRESGVDMVVNAVEQLIMEVLGRLHAATCAPHLTPEGKPGSGRGLEFAVGMHEGLEMWCRGMLALLEQKGADPDSIYWLQEVVTYIGLSCSELRVSRALSFLLTHAHLQSQLSPTVAIFRDIQARHLSLAHSTLQHCITSIQQPLPSLDTLAPSPPHLKLAATHDNLLTNFASNMLSILRVDQKGQSPDIGVDNMTRCQFGRGLLEQLLPLTQLLSQAVQHSSSSTDQLLLILDLIRSVLEQEWAEPEGGCGHMISPQSRGRVLQALVSEYFTMMRILARSLKKEDHTHLQLEVALGKFLWLISWCVKGSSHQPLPPSTESSTHSSFDSNARVMAFNLIMETILADRMSAFFTPSSSWSQKHTTTSPAPSSSTSSSSHSDLLGTYSSMSSGHWDKKEPLLKHHHRELSSYQHNGQSSICLSGHLHQLLLTVSSSSPSPHLAQKELAQVMLDQVAPQFLAQLKQWPEEDTLKYSQERDLNIKRMFDSKPVLWSILQLISDPLSANEPAALVCCAPVVRSLMTVLTQHWQRCCANSPTRFPWELENTIILVECLAKSLWLRPPLAYVGALLPQLTPYEITSLLTCINTSIKVNFEAIKNGRQPEAPDKASCELVKGILLNHMHLFGHLYAKFLDHQDRN